MVQYRTGTVLHMRFGHHQENIQQLYQYRCLSCGTILKETQSPIDNSILCSLKNERCISCGSELQEQTIAVESASMKQQLTTSNSSAPSLLLPSKLERAFDLRLPKLTFDIPKLDSLLDLADKGVICVTSSSTHGSSWHANTLVTRACVRALMSGRQGGFGSPSIIFIDAGNCSDVYECVDFARQYGLDSDKILDSIIVSRPFTIHQLAGLVVYNLESAIQRFNVKLVVISDILSMFVTDPQIDTDEAQWLIKEIARTLKRLSNLALIVVSMTYSIIPPYASALMRIFTSRIEMGTNPHQVGCIQLKVSDLCYQTIRTTTLREIDLQLVPAR